VFYGTRKFITAFTTAHHLSLFWARSIQSMSQHFYIFLPLKAWVFQVVSLPQVSPPNLCMQLNPMRATNLVHPILLDVITRIFCELCM
jgi:hypothetical protein